MGNGSRTEFAESYQCIAGWHFWQKYFSVACMTYNPPSLNDPTVDNLLLVCQPDLPAVISY